MSLKALYEELISHTSGEFFQDSDLEDKLFTFVYGIGRTDIQRRGCRDCVGRAIYALRTYKPENLELFESNMKKIYKFKKGKKYRPPGWDKILTETNCTQEDAIKCLERQPGAIIYFDVELVPDQPAEQATEQPNKPKRKKQKHGNTSHQGGAESTSTKE